jgi:hypothetical protein
MLFSRQNINCRTSKKKAPTFPSKPHDPTQTFIIARTQTLSRQQQNVQHPTNALTTKLLLLWGMHMVVYLSKQKTQTKQYMKQKTSSQASIKAFFLNKSR